jgi:hypothetical protein
MPHPRAVSQAQIATLRTPRMRRLTTTAVLLVDMEMATRQRLERLTTLTSTLRC